MGVLYLVVVVRVCSVFILWLLMDLPTFCVFKHFSAWVGLLRLCACTIISIYFFIFNLILLRHILIVHTSIFFCEWLNFNPLMRTLVHFTIAVFI